MENSIEELMKQIREHYLEYNLIEPHEEIKLSHMIAMLKALNEFIDSGEAIWPSPKLIG